MLRSSGLRVRQLSQAVHSRRRFAHAIIRHNDSVHSRSRPVRILLGVCSQRGVSPCCCSQNLHSVWFTPHHLGHERSRVHRKQRQPKRATVTSRHGFMVPAAQSHILFRFTLCVTLLQRHSGFWLFRCIKLPMLCSIPWHSRFPFQAATFSTLGNTCRITAWLLTRASRMHPAPATHLTARPHAQTTAPSPGQRQCCPRSRTAALLPNCRTKFSRMVRFRSEARCYSCFFM